MKQKLGVWIFASVLVISAAAVIIVLSINGQNDQNGGQAAGGNQAEVVVRVNDEEISKEDLYNEMYSGATQYGMTYGEQTLEILIEDMLIRQEAAKKGIELTDADIDQKVEEEIEGIKQEIGEDFEMILAQSGMTEESFREDLRKQLPFQLLVEKLFEDEIVISDDEVADYYNENKDFYGEPEQVEVSEIKTATREEAEQALAELEAGTEFATVADEFAMEQEMAVPGGSLGWVSRGMLHPDLEEAAFALESEEISQIIETDAGFHILQVHDKQEENIPDLSELREQIRKELFAEQLNVHVPAWLEEKKGEADIERT